MQRTCLIWLLCYLHFFLRPKLATFYILDLATLVPSLLLKAQERNSAAAFAFVTFWISARIWICARILQAKHSSKGQLIDAQYLYDVQESEGTISQMLRMSYDVEIRGFPMRRVRTISDHEWTKRLLLRKPK